jgi:type I restriction enzyme M protein
VTIEEKMKALREELAKQFEEGAMLERKIRENLEGIGL